MKINIDVYLKIDKMIPKSLESEIIKYLKFIAKQELGSAPSAGYFEQIILKARELLKEKNNNVDYQLFNK